MMGGNASYAVNLSDVDARMRPIGGMVLQGYATVASPTIMVDKGQPDTTAVILDGPQARTALVTSLIAWLTDQRIRCYAQGPRGGWQRIGREQRTCPIKGEGTC